MGDSRRGLRSTWALFAFVACLLLVGQLDLGRTWRASLANIGLLKNLCDSANGCPDLDVERADLAPVRPLPAAWSDEEQLDGCQALWASRVAASESVEAAEEWLARAAECPREALVTWWTGHLAWLEGDKDLAMERWSHLPADYLIGLGHRRIGFIGGRPDLQCAQRRLQGYQYTLRQANIPLDPALIAAGDFTKETGQECARQLLSLPEPPTAIFAANDQSAMGAIKAARNAGLRVPDDLSVIGFDNIPEAAYFDPALTTIDQFMERMGYTATETLIDLVQGKPLERELHKVPTQLIVRDSCQTITDGA